MMNALKHRLKMQKKQDLTFEFIPETAHKEHPNTARLVMGDDEAEMSC